MGGVVARPYPFFVAQDALGWWLYILGGGYSPYPHCWRVVCLRHALEDGGYSSLVFLLSPVFFLVGGRVVTLLLLWLLPRKAPWV